MIRLYESDCVTIGDFRCAGHDHGAEEAASAHEIALVRRGVFQKDVRGERVLASAGCAVFFRKDEPYRVTHPAGGDACTTIRLRGDVLRDWLAERDPVTHVACNAPTHRLHLQLHHALASGRCDDLLVEEIVFDVCRSILRRGRVPSGPARASTARDHRDVAHAARIHLHRHMGGKVLLGDVARAVHCSPYHLARIFAREAGMPMHCYLNHLRLSEAVARMDGGQRDLTALALSLGFGDHSHFTNAFKRAFGRSPGRFRRGSTARELRELSKNLQV